MCLHGFGEAGESFGILQQQLPSAYALLWLDLPFHGATVWVEEGPLEPSALIEILYLLFRKEGYTPGKKFGLLAYSMGGRLALQLLQAIPQQVERMVLLAPDGLHVNFWYWLGTQTYPGNKLFYKTMQHPAWFFAIAHWANKAGMISSSILKFMHSYLDDKTARMLLYKRWMALRKFKPVISLIRKEIRTHHIPVRLVFGSNDRIILSKRSDVFKRDTAHVKVIILKAGHQLLKDQYAAGIIQLFSD